MKYTIGKFDKETGTVPVSFTEGAIKHDRRVNAVLSGNGAYDAAGTKLRVAEVANGVAAKIEAGVITNPPKPEANPE